MTTIEQQISQLLEALNQSLTTTQDFTALETLRSQYLGKKGQITELLKQLATLSGPEKAQAGQIINRAKNTCIALFEQHQAHLQQLALAEQLKTETLDVTLPGRQAIEPGSAHPVNRIRQRIEQLFIAEGFSIAEGPEIEDDYHNFEALNFPQYHPARAMHDTFYFENGLLLRTHTSSVQIRVMEQSQPPLRIITPGRVYRCDSDQTHTPMFHQLEGLVVDEHCTFADLKGMLQDFLNRLFERELDFRFRASYFPFTEPSAEADIACVLCQGQGCRLCSHSGWIEVLGAGMVHPNVLSMCNIDPERYSGFAFGIGIDRLAMLRYGIDDLRKLFENDLRFLRPSSL
ncbi:MAG: phenylalanine--tRNA ligase subunit alpha [Gammaproteobacteria bacterium]